MEGKTATEAEEKNTAHFLWKVIRWRVDPTNMLLNLKGLLLSRYATPIKVFFSHFLDRALWYAGRVRKVKVQRS